MHRLLPTVLAVAALFTSAQTFAQSPKAGARPPTAPAAGPDRADELFTQGAAAYRAGRLAEAEDKLGQAWALKKTHDIAGDLGIVELKLGKFPRAAEHLAWALRHFPPTESDTARKGFDDMLAKARLEVAALVVRVNVDGAEVVVNGRDVGAAPIDEVFVEPGSVTVAAQRDGYQPAQQTLTIAKGSSREVSLSLAPVGVQRRSIVPGAVLGGVAGAALVTGIGLMIGGASKHASNTTLNQSITQAHQSCAANALNFDAQCAALASGASTADALNHAGIGVLVGAGAAAVGSVVYFVWPESKPSAPRAGGIHVAPTVSTSGAGVLFSGAF